jgi:hypothetical protein
VRALQGPRGGNDLRWAEDLPEDDPLRDLRPHDEETEDPVAEEYVWPDLNDNEDDD